MQFRPTLTFGFATITSIFLTFGLVGYVAFGDTTCGSITQNLPPDWTTDTVKLALCTALFFTFPMMMVPVYEIVERGAEYSAWFQYRFGATQRCLSSTMSRQMHGLLVCG